MTQNERLLEYLEQHGHITSLEALTKLGIVNCARRVEELRDDGYVIEAESVGSFCYLYTLIEPKPQENDPVCPWLDNFMRIFGFKRLVPA